MYIYIYICMYTHIHIVIITRIVYCTIVYDMILY